MERVPEQQGLLAVEEEVTGVRVGGTGAAVGEEDGRAADGIGDARGEAGALADGHMAGAGRAVRGLAAEEGGQRDGVEGRGVVGASGERDMAEAVPAGGGPVAHRHAQGNPAGVER